MLLCLNIIIMIQEYSSMVDTVHWIPKFKLFLVLETKKTGVPRDGKRIKNHEKILAKLIKKMKWSSWPNIGWKNRV